MATIDYVRATDEHAAQVLSRLRQPDAEEIRAMGCTPEFGMASSLELATDARAWVVDGRAVCIFGYRAPDLMGQIAYPWLLTTDLVEDNRTAFGRRSRLWVRQLAASFPRLENLVDSRYTECLKWLAWLGFTVDEAKPLGPYGIPFHRFHMGQEHGY